MHFLLKSRVITKRVLSEMLCPMVVLKVVRSRLSERPLPLPFPYYLTRRGDWPYLQEERPHRRVQHLVGHAGLVQSDPLLDRATPGGAHGQQPRYDPCLLPTAHGAVRVQHGAHQGGAAPRDAADENERRVFGEEVGLGGLTLIGQQHVELRPSAPGAFGGALEAAGGQVDERGRAEEDGAQQQQQTAPAAPHGGEGRAVQRPRQGSSRLRGIIRRRRWLAGRWRGRQAFAEVFHLALLPLQQQASRHRRQPAVRLNHGG